MSEGIEPAQERGDGRAGPRVLQVVPGLGEGGAERGTVDLARYLIAQGWTALVATSGGRGESELRQLGTPVFRLPLQAKNPLVIRANIGRLQRLVQEQGVQLIHARSRAAAWSSRSAARRCGIPFVTTFHGVYRGSTRFLKRRYNGIMAQGDRVIAVSEHVADHVREHYGVADDRLRVIPRGIDLDAFATEAIARGRIEGLARRWHVPKGSKVVMLPGRLTRIKGHLLLLEAIAAMNRRNFVCLLVGRPGRRVAMSTRSSARSRRVACPRWCGWSAAAATCRPRSRWPTWWWCPRSVPRRSAGSRSRPRRSGGRWSRPTSAASARP
jgi:glycosyltransferase involved in cell wall biosynthesis